MLQNHNVYFKTQQFLLGTDIKTISGIIYVSLNVISHNGGLKDCKTLKTESLLTFMNVAAKTVDKKKINVSLKLNCGKFFCT